MRPEALGWEMAPAVCREYLLEGIVLGSSAEGVQMARGLAERLRFPWGQLLALPILGKDEETIGALAEGGNPLWLGEADAAALEKTRDRLDRWAVDLLHFRLPPLESRTVLLADPRADVVTAAVVERLRELKVAEIWGVFGAAERDLSSALDKIFIGEGLLASR